jgi:hypothetical protein
VLSLFNIEDSRSKAILVMENDYLFFNHVSYRLLWKLFFTESAAFWGAVSGLAYFAIVYEIWLGEASKQQAAEMYCCAQNIMLVCTCRLVNLPIRVYDEQLDGTTE